MDVAIEERPHPGRAATLARVLSATLGVAGLWSLGTLLVEIAKTLRHLPSEPHPLFAIILDAAGLLVCAWWLRAAWLGWHHQSAKAIRWLSASLVTVLVFGTLVVAGHFDLLHSGTPADGNWREPPHLLLAPLVTIAHLGLSRSLTSRLALPDERSLREQKRSVERAFGLTTFLFWTNASAVAIGLLPKPQGRNIPTEHREALATLGPILLAVILYKLCVRFYSPRQR